MESTVETEHYIKGTLPSLIHSTISIHNRRRIFFSESFIMYAVVLLMFCMCSWVALLCPSVQAYGKVYNFYTLNSVQYC